MEINGEILVVDDEKMIREAVCAYLAKMGHKTVEADNGRDALSLFERGSVGFVILDLMLPELSGEEVCSAIRRSSSVPIIMLTAKTQEESVLNGLNIGADDYVTKPFSVKELYARMEAVSRRVSMGSGTVTTGVKAKSDLEIDGDAPVIRKKGTEITLTRSEWRIISSMAAHPGKVYTRDELMEIAFGEESDSFDRVIDTHIKNLRKKIEDDSRNPVYIRTVHGIGYKFGGSGL